MPAAGRPPSQRIPQSRPPAHRGGAPGGCPGVSGGLPRGAGHMRDHGWQRSLPRKNGHANTNFRPRRDALCQRHLCPQYPRSSALLPKSYSEKRRPAKLYFFAWWHGHPAHVPHGCRHFTPRPTPASGSALSHTLPAWQGTARKYRPGFRTGWRFSGRRRRRGNWGIRRCPAG